MTPVHLLCNIIKFTLLFQVVAAIAFGPAAAATARQAAAPAQEDAPLTLPSKVPVSSVQRNVKDGTLSRDGFGSIRGGGLARSTNAAASQAETPRTALPGGYRVGIEKQFEETSYFLKDTDFISPTVGWAVGEPHWNQLTKAYAGTILKTSDGGLNWMAQGAGAGEVLNGVDFVDADHGWAAGTNGTVLRTSDGGAHWISHTLALTDELRSVSFVDVEHGWMTSVRPTHHDVWGDPDNWQARIWHTANGGATWVQQVIPEDASILHDIQFLDALNGWAVGVRYSGDDQYGRPDHRAVIYYTSDGGETWAEQPYGPEELEITFTAVYFHDVHNGWVVGFAHYLGMVEGTIFHTTDGGDTWQRQTPQAIFWDVQFVDEARGYVVGFDYIGAQGPPVYRTLDGGATWEKVLMPRHELEGLFGLEVAEDRVIAVGDHDYLAIATDPWGPYEEPWGENLFTSQYLNIHYRFEDVFFVDENQGWAVGSRSFLPDLWGQVIFHTADGGLSWESQYEQAPLMDKLFSVFRLDSVYFVDDQTGWAVGMSEYDASYDPRWAILYTTDGGLHWEEQGQELYDGLAPEFFAVQFLDEQNGWALDTGHYDPELGAQALYLAQTTNSGANWEWVDTAIPGYLDIGFALVQGGLDFPDAQHGWAAGGLGTVIHTGDGGSTWITQTLTCDWPTCVKRLFAIDFINIQEGWIAGEGLYQTTDGGSHWNMEDPGFDVDFHDVQFVDPVDGWLAGDAGVILYTVDGGSSWKLADNGVSSANLRGLSFISPVQGWLVGESGTILTTVEIPYWPVFLPLVIRTGAG